MTPYNKNEKPPIMLSAQFQSGLLLFIAGLAVTMTFKIWGFTSNLNSTIRDHENRIHSIEDRQKTTESRIDILSGYTFKQGRQQTP